MILAWSINRGSSWPSFIKAGPCSWNPPSRKARIYIMNGVSSIAAHGLALQGATDPQVWYQSIFHTITEMTMLSCWWNFRHWLQPKLSKWQLWTRPMMKIWWKGQHLSFTDMPCFTREGLLMTKGFWWDENTWSVTLVTVEGVTFLCQFQCRFHLAHLTDLKDPIRQRRLGISFFSSWYIPLEILISTYFL